MESKYLYINVLNRLNNEGVGFECEILDLFDIKDAIKDKYGPIGLLEVMKENKHITYVHFYDEKGYNKPFDANKMPIISIMASITFPGMEYLMNYDLNIKTKNNFIIQQVLNLLTVGVISLTLYYTIQTVLKDNLLLDSMKAFQSKLSSEQEQVNKLKDTLSTWNKYAKRHGDAIVQKTP